MVWNWQQSDWPDFTWDPTRLARAEEAFLLGAGVLLGSVRHLGEAERDNLIVEAITGEALTTSEIEGEFLDRDSVQSSIRRQFGLSTDDRLAAPAERGIAEMMVDLYHSYAAPLDEAKLSAWHRMLLQERPHIGDIGRYRTHASAMQVVSGALHDPKIHFEAPPSAEVPAEMDRFIEWFNRTAPGGLQTLPALTRAGVTHLYFVSIHPYEDGNGRIARALSEKALAQGVGRQTLTSLAATILFHRRGYYDALQAANKGNEITRWLAWFAGVSIEAQRRTQAQIEFILDKARLLDRLRGELNERQEKALHRMLREGPTGFKGGLSAGNYMSITGASPATATRDLADLVSKRALQRRGERRHARYFLDIPIRPTPRVTVTDRGDVVADAGGLV